VESLTRGDKSDGPANENRRTEVEEPADAEVENCQTLELNERRISLGKKDSPAGPQNETRKKVGDGKQCGRHEAEHCPRHAHGPGLELPMPDHGLGKVIHGAKPDERRRLGISRVAAIAWSDTATFLVEAEVVHPMQSDVVRNSYPVIFGDALNFTLPPAAEGVSIQAELNGETIVFPLGPALILSWADCNARINPDQTRVYRCELKPGYRWLGNGA